MNGYEKLISGFRDFKATTYQNYKDLVVHLVRQGQKPNTLVICCCDLRISPDNIVSCNPGDLYVIRNVAGLVPKYDEGGSNGTIAAIEYAVNNVGVENIVVLGHAHCDGIKKLMIDDKISKDSKDPVASWLSIALDAKNAVLEQVQDKSDDEKARVCEMESVLISLKNLLGYPFITDKAKKGQINLFGWHFDIEQGELVAFDPRTKFFEPVG